MYLLLAIFVIIAGITLFIFAQRKAKNRPVAISIKIVSIALIAMGISMLYLLLSENVVLPLSKD